MPKPIYFRVINQDLDVYDEPDTESKKVGKIKKGEIHVAINKKGIFFELDDDTYCLNSPNRTLIIPVDDVIELNGKYRVKEDLEVTGMSRRRSVDVGKITGGCVIGILISFVVLVAYTMAYCWKSMDSSPLVTILGGYMGVIAVVSGLYVWRHKNTDIVTMKKKINENNIDDSGYVEKLISEQEYDNN